MSIGLGVLILYRGSKFAILHWLSRSRVVVSTVQPLYRAAWDYVIVNDLEQSFSTNTINYRNVGLECMRVHVLDGLAPRTSIYLSGLAHAYTWQLLLLLSTLLYFSIYWP